MCEICFLYVKCACLFPHPQGTPERLIMHLVEEPSVVDPTYIEDFLLTYRTFLSNPMEVGKKLLEWFQVDTLRDTVSFFCLCGCFGRCVFTELTIMKTRLASLYVEQQYVYARRLCVFLQMWRHMIHNVVNASCGNANLLYWYMLVKKKGVLLQIYKFMYVSCPWAQQLLVPGWQSRCLLQL